MKQGILGIRTFVVPASIVLDTLTFLRKVGIDGCEGFALWAGKPIGSDRFQFLSCVIPEQRAMVTPSGLLVTVDGKALFDVNRALYERGELLAAQVHSHPTNAYHSETDDAFPLVTIVGGLSIVIPNFAHEAPADMESWAWYRLSKNAKWEAAADTTEIEVE